MKSIEVRLGTRSYPVLVGEGLLDHVHKTVRGLGLTSPPVIVTNAAVFRMHGERLLAGLRASREAVRVIRIGDGERFKNQKTLARIYDSMFRAGADRRSWVLAFGGGVVGDIAGFAAATFMRGIPYVGVPTTLLSQVDSSIGGKVGINVPQGKNLVGAYHQPSAVLSDTSVLKTLPPRELAAGLFEVVKCGAIRSEPLLRFIERRLAEILDCRPGPLQHIILEASRIKAEIVSGDEREEHLRMFLNYGHTVGHALEAATEYRRFRHGEAVAWGMIAALAYGRQLGLLETGDVERVVRLIHSIESLPPLKGISGSRVWSALRHDKKFRGSSIRMVLLPRLGEAEVRSDIDPRHLRSFLRQFLRDEGRIG